MDTPGHDLDESWESAEDEGEDSTSEQAEPLDLTRSERKLVTQPYDFPVSSLRSDIEAGRIKLSIEYQRQYVWDSGKASRLIESLLLNVPIPVCYFAEVDDGSYEVIDGLQRLTTIRNFLEGQTRLGGLSVLSELNGKRFEDLDARDQRRLQNRTIRCIVITEESDPDIKFDVFERLNTGAAVLNAQELRNSVYRGEYNDSLKSIAQAESVRECLGISRNTRMDVEEIALRYFALRDGFSKYSPPLRQFLNNHMRKRRLTKLSEEEVSEFTSALNLAVEVFGTTPFRGNNSRNAVNKALFDAIMIPLSSVVDPTQLAGKESELRHGLSRLLELDSFVQSIGRATADRTRMFGRVLAVAGLLRDAGIELNLTVPETAEDSREKLDEQRGIL